MCAFITATPLTSALIARNAVGATRSKRFSSRTAKAPVVAQIKLFDNTNLRGESVTLTETVRDLRGFPFNDKAASCEIKGNETWVLYEDVDFDGRAIVLTEGEYPNLVVTDLGNDRLSSLRLLDAPAKSTITIFTGRDFGNTEFTSNSAVAQLSSNLQDETSSAIIQSGTWLLYRDSNFQGPCSVLGPGHYHNFSDFGFPEDTLTSMRPLENAFTMFVDNNFRGTAFGSDGDVNQLSPNLQDKLSSVIIQEGTWELFQNSFFAGASIRLTPGLYTFIRLTGLQNDTVSSFRRIG